MGVLVVSPCLHIKLEEPVINTDEKHGFAATLQQSSLDMK